MYEITFKIDEAVADKLAKIHTIHGLLEDARKACLYASGDLELQVLGVVDETRERLLEISAELVSLHLLARKAIIAAKHAKPKSGMFRIELKGVDCNSQIFDELHRRNGTYESGHGVIKFDSLDETLNFLSDFTDHLGDTVESMAITKED